MLAFLFNSEAMGVQVVYALISVLVAVAINIKGGSFFWVRRPHRQAGREGDRQGRQGSARQRGGRQAGSQARLTAVPCPPCSLQRFVQGMAALIMAIQLVYWIFAFSTGDMDTGKWAALPGVEGFSAYSEGFLAFLACLPHGGL